MNVIKSMSRILLPSGSLVYQDLHTPSHRPSSKCVQNGHNEFFFESNGGHKVKLQLSINSDARWEDWDCSVITVFQSEI